jgi:hypothetical protein
MLVESASAHVCDFQSLPVRGAEDWKVWVIVTINTKCKCELL